MDSSLIADLLQSYEAMKSACNTLSRAVNGDAGLPLYLPTYKGEPGGQRQAASDAMTQLWHLDPGESLETAGILCASDNTVTAATELNTCKDAFQQSVKAIRAIGKNDEKARIDRLIERALHIEGLRTEELKEALATARINRLDLLRCYAKIRLMPRDLQSISWTWAKTHCAIVQVSIDEAVEMADKLSNRATAGTVIDLLSRLPSGEKLAYKKNLPNQLRANLVWMEQEERKRKAVTISGIVISQDEVLPRYVWRDNPDTLEPDQQNHRLSRIDIGIEASPYIKALHLHRYISDYENA